jgi:hypothetical protein
MSANGKEKKMDESEDALMKQAMEAPLAIRYVNGLLLKMYKEGPDSVKLIRSQPFPPAPRLLREGEAESLDFSEIIQRLKKMSEVDPAPCKEPTDGQIPLTVAGAPARAHLHFDDTCDDPFCEVRMVKGASEES